MQLLFKLSHFRISSTNSEVRTTPAKSSINNDTRCNMTWGVVGIRQSSRSWTCTLVKLGLTACSVVAQSDVGYSGSLFSLQCEQMVVVGSLLCSERFLSRYSGFSLLFVVGSVSLEFFIFPALSLHNLFSFLQCLYIWYAFSANDTGENGSKYRLKHYFKNASITFLDINKAMQLRCTWFEIIFVEFFVGP